MSKLVLVDGNSIMNRAFYGIIGSKTLMTSDGKYTNAIYGFLAILFKLIEDVKPEYIVVSFDLRQPTHRHLKYKEYKANRKGMPDELAQQMPVIKEILKKMNIDIVEKPGYEADDVLGTLAKYGENQGLEVIILSGDRDTFQLATDKVTIYIPITKTGKTTTQQYDRKRIIEEYGLEPKQLIDVKGLQGDNSDNIPGVPGIGPKTAITLIKKFGTMENLYKKLENNEDELKGKQRENIEANKELAILSKDLGTINVEVPIEHKLEQFKVEEWNKKEVLKIFEELKFSRYIERFALKEITQGDKEEIDKKEKNKIELKIQIKTIKEIIGLIKKQNKMIFYLGTKKDENPEKIIKEKITDISVYNEETKEEYYIKLKEEKEIQNLKEIFENQKIKKIGTNLTRQYILLKQNEITMNGIEYDVQIAAYILNPSNNKLDIERLSNEYLEIDINQILKNMGVEENKTKQINLFEEMEKNNSNEEEKINEIEKYKYSIYVLIISKLKEITKKKLKEIGAIELFETIDMPTIEVLSEMQWNGMYVDSKELESFGKELREKIETVRKIIYEMIGQEFNINSPKQLGEILFEKMKLPVQRKTKSGYSTDVDVLEKLKGEDPVIEQILEYRQLMKLNSTYVEGLKPYINPKTHRIHSFFHQTITATGRISSTEPNLQNIPTRFELGKRVRKVFEPEEGKTYIDADYSQIELRVLADISKDIHMVEAFNNNEDIHKQAASKVFKTPINEVTKEQRSNAKAVNFGIVYGISDFGLGEQLGISRKQAKQYIEEYLEQYQGIKEFMENITNQAKEQGYVETLFHRRRYIPELKSTNYMVRQFGSRVAMNTPIQGTAADIMKIAMINVNRKIKQEKLKAKIILQVHDEMLIEAENSEIERIKEIVKEQMETAIKLKVPLIADISEADNWYECK